MSYPTYTDVVEKRRKPLLWLHGQVKTPPFSSAARVEAGVLIGQLQCSVKLSLPHSRPMPGIGRACHELRIQDESCTWRIVYYVDAVAIVVLEVFAKETSQTPQMVIDVCKARLKRYKSI